MNRRAALLALVLLAVFAMPARAADPAGPRLAISAYANGPGGEDESWEVMTTGPLGESPQRLVGGLQQPVGDALSWSADGGRLAFGVSGIKSTASGPFGTGWQVVGVTLADGGPLHVFPRAFLNAGEPVMAPDGRSVAFQRLKVVKPLPEGEDDYLLKSSVWLLDLKGGGVRRLTRWRLERFLEPISFSLDGSSLVATLDDRRGRRIVAVDLHSHRTRPLSLLDAAAAEPTYSPDGTRLAFVRLQYLHKSNLPLPVSELVVADADGGGARRLMRVKGYITSPSWDPSGSRLAFVRNPPDEGVEELELEPGNKVMAVNPDGTCLTRVFTDPGVAVQGIAWQPGVGREAGPISC